MNIQTIPRTDKVIKKAFIPKLDCFLFFDYKQIEPRLLAYYLSSIGDDSMSQVFIDKRDIYVEIASSVLNKDTIDEEDRQIGKTLVLSIIYGGGVPTIMRQLNVEVKEARALLGEFHTTWPGIKALIQEVIQLYHRRGFIKTLAGRHLRPEDDHKALNALIQGSAAELIRQAVVKAYKGLESFESHLVCTVHDELILDVSKNEVIDVRDITLNAMSNAEVEEFVPIEVDIEWSDTTWAEKRDIAEYRGLRTEVRF